MSQRPNIRTLGRFTLAVSLAYALGACGAEEDRCAELGTEDSCMRAQGCAWGTDEEGPHCFYVGDVVPQ